MISKIKQFRIPRKFVYWYLTTMMLGCVVFTTWGMITNRPDYMMGIFGGFLILTLINNLDNKGKWSAMDIFILVVFGLTTIAIPFIA